nr:hypothetical protein [uncultured Flavonifractor sp.]
MNPNKDHPPKPIPLLSLSNTFATQNNTHPKSPGQWPGLFGAPGPGAAGVSLGELKMAARQGSHF